MFRGSNDSRKRYGAGFTMLELVIVVAIIGILTTMAAATYNSIEYQRKVTLAAQQIQADLRYAQNLAISFKKHQGKFARGGYGVHFENNSPAYKIFADLDCNGASDCSPAGPLCATSGTTTTLQDSARSWTPNQWKGGDVLIRGGQCGGSLRYVRRNTADILTVSESFEDLNGNDCAPAGGSCGASPSNASEYVVFGNARFDPAQGELVEEKMFDTVRILVPVSSYDIVFSPPAPEIKADREVISGGAKATVTVSAGAFTKFIDVYSNGLVEIR